MKAGAGAVLGLERRACADDSGVMVGELSTEGVGANEEVNRGESTATP